MEDKCPGQALAELRGQEGLQRKAFAELTGWSYHTQLRLEQSKTRFRRSHLDMLMAVGWISEGDQWHQRFKDAMAWQSQRATRANAVSEPCTPEPDGASTAQLPRAEQEQPRSNVLVVVVLLQPSCMQAAPHNDRPRDRRAQTEPDKDQNGPPFQLPLDFERG